MMTPSMTHAAPSTASMLTSSVYSMIIRERDELPTAEEGLSFLSVSSRCFSALSLLLSDA